MEWVVNEGDVCRHPTESVGNYVTGKLGGRPGAPIVRIVLGTRARGAIGAEGYAKVEARGVEKECIN